MCTGKKVIISFDGNVYSGKSTLINLVSEGNNVIGEHSQYFNERDFLLKDQLIIQRKYLEIDALRINELVEGINLLDRSLISLAAHVWAIQNIGGKDIRKEFIKDIFIEQKNKPIIPHVFVFVKCSRETTLRRFKDNENTVNSKGTLPYLLSYDYFRLINIFLKRISKKINTIIIDTENLSKEEAKVILSQKIKNKLSYKNNISSELIKKTIIDELYKNV